MSDFAIPKLSFQNGEISPQSMGRADSALYQISAERMINFVPRKEGAALFRNSMRAVRETIEGTLLLPFKVSKDQGYILEVRPDGVLNLLNKDGILNRDLGPFSFSSYFDAFLGYDVLRIDFTNNHGLGTFSRIDGYDASGAIIWSYQTRPSGGSDDNSMTFLEDYAGFVTDGFTTATVSIRQTATTTHGFNMGVNGVIDFAKFQYAQRKNEIYLVHESIRPQEIVLNDDGYTLDARNIAFTLDLRTAAIIGGSIFPPRAKGPVYPNAIAFYEQRMVLGLGDELYFSNIGLFKDFVLDDGGAPPNVTDANGLVITPANRENLDVQWIQSSEKFLLVGSTASNIVVTPSSEYGTITPFNVNARDVDKMASEPVLAQNADGRVFYTERGNRKISYVNYSTEVRGHVTRDSTKNKEHITEGLVRRMAFKRGEPSELFCLKDDGEIISVVLNEERTNEGFYRIRPRFGDQFVDLTVTYNAEGLDTIYVIIKRNNKFYIETMDLDLEYLTREDFFTGVNNKDADQEAFDLYLYKQQCKDVRLDFRKDFERPINLELKYELDGGVHYFYVDQEDYFTDLSLESPIVGKKVLIYGLAEGYEILSINEVTGKSRIEIDVIAGVPQKTNYGVNGTIGIDAIEEPLYASQTLNAVADGYEISLTFSAGGLCILPTAYKFVAVGYKYLGILKPLPLEFVSDAGVSFFSNKNISRICLNVFNSGPFKYGSDLYSLQTAETNRKKLFLPAPYFTGDRCESFDDNAKTIKSYYIVQDSPFALNLRNMSPYVQVGPR